jgi:hypothetical protein
MADEYKDDDADEAPKKPKKRAKKADEDEVCRVALERYGRWYERERDNVKAAYDDLEFCWNDAQWPEDVVKERRAEDRPCLIVNRLPQFVHQVTGEMRQMKPGIKVVPVDSNGDKKTAEAIGGMIRYVENRSTASRIYTGGADSQVSCGIGAWRVTKEYSGKNTFNQELRIVGVDDAVAIAVDPDSILPTREDAQWMIVPVDLSNDAFKEKYPDLPIEDFDSSSPYAQQHGWFSKDMVRVAEYWVKKPIKRTLALMKDGGIVDLTGEEPDEIEKVKAQATRVEPRDSFKVCRYLITAAHVLEEIDWPGMFIPIVFAVGEEIRIGRKIVRRGLVRSAKDSQRAFNYFTSAHAEVVGLQPKAPFVATEKNVEKYQDEWANANRKALPVLPYTPDPANGGQAPQRVQPPVSSQGISEGLLHAADNMKATMGIYDPSLGQRSNETSGKAINARNAESDTGTFVYVDNWTLAIGHTGTIVSDLIPHVYDTERQIRIMGEDGQIDLKWINRPTGMQEVDQTTGEAKDSEEVENDVTTGAYDVVMESGPSYSTKRQEAKEAMVEFIRSAPDTAPAVMDLVAKGQDWPLADEFAKRLEAIAPPAVQKLIAGQKKEHGEQDEPQMPPTPAEQMQQQAAQLDLQNKKLINDKLQAETAKIAHDIGQAQQPDPHAMMKLQGEQQRIALDARRADMEHAAATQEMQFKAQIAAVQLETALVDLAIKKQGVMVDTASAALDIQGQQQDLMHAAQAHAAGLVQGFEKHASGLQMGAESHAAKVEQMKQKPEARP